MKPLLLPIVFLVSSVLCAGVPSAIAQDTAQHAPDGGTRERVESIEIPTISNVPFSAVVVTTWTRLLPDGNKEVVSNHRTVARDSAGRVFQERRYLMPDGTAKATPLSELQYDDPNDSSRTVCTRERVCRRYNWSFHPSATPPPPAAVLKLPNGVTITTEALGTDTVDGLEVIKSRRTMTIPAGVGGNEKAVDVVKEFWYSPRLGINVMTKRTDPRISSIQTFELTNINLSEPDPKLLQLPDGFHVIDVSSRQ
jgi:hypothetical protein